MKMVRFFAAFTLASAMSIGVAAGHEVKTEEYKLDSAVVKSLFKGPLTDGEGKTVLISHFTVPPGFETAKHFHPGAVFLYVLEGSLEIETAAGTKTISAGELLEEVPNQDMIGRNASAKEPAKFLIFQVGDTGKPMMVKSK